MKIKRLLLPSQLAIMKNVTPNQLALGISCLIGTCTFLLSILAYLFLSSYKLNPFAVILILSILYTMISYLIFYYAIEKFIYRKIKVIYKQIRRMKRPKGTIVQQLSMNRNMLDEVEMQVREWAKEQREEIDQLKKMEQYRREFLGNVSHELKTPIYNIQGYLDTLISTKLQDKDINMKYLKKANNNADRLNRIVEDLEIITKHEAGELKLKIENFKIYDLAKEVMESYEMLTKEKNITLEFKDGSDRNVQVAADYEQIRVVLSNLIINSIKYGNKHGTTWVGIYRMDKDVLIEISDNGVGIEQRHLTRVFERFYRVDESRSRKKGGGSGLGLAIVKHIIEAHNKSVHVRSKENVGTTFGFTLKMRV